MFTKKVQSGFLKPLRPMEKAINDYACTVGIMAQTEDNGADVGQLVKGLLEEIRDQGAKTLHPLVYANLVFIIGCVFSCGVLWNKVATLEARSSALEAKATAFDAIQVLSVKVDTVQQELGRIRDHLEQGGAYRK